MRIALYDLDTGTIQVLDHMDQGKNVSPQWSPDGQSIAFVSDRNGVSNIFLYELGNKSLYQLTDFYTGTQGITPLSPVLSWAPKADRLAFVYFEKGKYDVYSITNPRGLKRQPYKLTAPDSSGLLATTTPTVADTTPSLQVPEDVRPQVGEGGSIYRTPEGVPVVQRSGADRGHDDHPAADLDRCTTGFCQLQPAGYQRVHHQGLPGPLHTRLCGTPIDRICSRQLWPGLLRRQRGVTQ